MEGLVTMESPKQEFPRGQTCGPKRILVTGAEGYIGSVLVARLQARGHDVVGLDTGYYRAGWLYNDGQDRPKVLNRDVRALAADDLAGFDAIAHLAELSNDPLGAHDPDKTFQINHLASVRLAQNAKEAGVSRFIYMSSCSVYGAAGHGAVDESSPVNPQTAYAQCKVLVERDVMGLADASFSPTFLRNATAFGVSPRMRFDIVLNNLAGFAWTTRRIAMTSDGTPWRPIVHIEDICSAILATLEAPTGSVAGEVFNVGSNDNNYRIAEIAKIVADVFPDCEVTFGNSDGDTRSYRVAFDKIGKILPEYKCAWDARRGARQLRSLCEHIGLTKEMFAAFPYTRVKELQRLTTTNQLDETLRWTNLDLS